MIQNKDIVVVKGYKDFSIVIVKKSDYVTKSDTIIDRQYYGRLTYRHYWPHDFTTFFVETFIN